jgi:LysR family glycine cleavage system transcriptional activator
MPRQLPPLTALRAFEAAARHASFARAAEELSITPAAVSQQVRLLEESLGAHLFERRARGVDLTSTGIDYARELGLALDRIAAATERLKSASSPGTLTISTTHSFALKWLLPRLIRFQSLHPELDVRLSTSNALTNFDSQDIDIAIRYGRGRWPGLSASLLTHTELLPVASPALRDGAKPIRTPADLSRHTILHLMADRWPEWLAVANISDFDPQRGPRYSDISLMMQAAIEGQGVALGQSLLVADDIASGRLVELFSLRIPAAAAYYLVGPPGTLKRPKVRAFQDWLREELAGTQA